jgi:hypothetical protein
MTWSLEGGFQSANTTTAITTTTTTNTTTTESGGFDREIGDEVRYGDGGGADREKINNGDGGGADIDVDDYDLEEEDPTEAGFEAWRRGDVTPL